MSEYIKITLETLLRHTKSDGTCDLRDVLYKIVCPDGDESNIEQRGIEFNSPKFLVIDKVVNIIDDDSLSTGDKNITSFCFEWILFQKDVLINLGDIISDSLKINDIECLGSFEVFPNFSEIYVCDSQFNNLFLSEDSKNEFKNCIFKNHVSIFEDINKLDNTTFDTCIFERKQLFNHLRLENVAFTNSVFKEKVSFESSHLDNCDFTRTEFHQKVSFKNATLKNTTFHTTKFQDKVSFFGATFKDNPVFDNLILSDTSHLYFNDLNPNDPDLSIEKFALINTVINGRIDFSVNIIKCLDMKDSTIIGTITRTNFHPQSANWQTACLLKNEALKQNNIIEALKYKASEKNLYMIESFKKFRLGELLSLLLSKFYHNHGQMWLLALFWTLVIWFFSFKFFKWGFGQTEIDTKFISELIRYLSPTEYTILTDCIKNLASLSTQNWLGILSFMLGKIFVPYGVYETIKAFRKFDKI